ncbi:MAG: phytanoyl-CoA dioxygenase family protein [Alphaproteobacteria bacterium]
MDEWLQRYRADGHATVAGLFTAAEMDAVATEIEAWADAHIAATPAAERAKFLDVTDDGSARPRWIDHPVRHCTGVGRLARDPRLVDVVTAIIGPDVDIYFSQVFFKPPNGGSPKPAHQDDFYAGVNNREGLVTAWIALDEASEDNGCLYFADGTHLAETLPHFAPKGRPFDLQIAADIVAKYPLSAAPVPKGGVSFHHVGVLHQSSANRSARWRRAAAVTYVTRDTYFANPGLDNYDRDLRIAVT